VIGRLRTLGRGRFVALAIPIVAALVAAVLVVQVNAYPTDGMRPCCC
jgi:hypothetical protein